MVVGVGVIRCETHGTEAETSTAPSTQTFVIIEGTVAEVSKIGRSI